MERADDAPALAAVTAIRAGGVSDLQRLLAEHPFLAKIRVDGLRTLLHVVTDWPGHLPNTASMIGALLAAGADVNARLISLRGARETPLHWAASSDDVEAIDALLDGGADLEAPGAVIAGGTPLDDAVAFGQWQAARRLVERGAQMALWHAAALGLIDHVESSFTSGQPPGRYPWGKGSPAPVDPITVSFWCACHGGQRETAAYLLQRGAELNWVSVWDGLTPLDAARRSSAADVATWLEQQGARSAANLG